MESPIKIGINIAHFAWCSWVDGNGAVPWIKNEGKPLCKTTAYVGVVLLGENLQRNWQRKNI